MLQVFSISVLILLDRGSNLSFATPLVAIEFNVLPYVLMEPLLVTTPMGDSSLVEDSLEVVLYHCTIELL